MTDQIKYVTANRDAWNEVAPRHAARNQARLIALFRKGGYNHLEDIAQDMIRQTGIAGKTVVQIGCNNGIDLLSVKNMGAGRCLGIDQATAFLDQAREIAQAAGVADEVDFIEANVYALPANLSQSFDVALTTIGVVYWMPDLGAFFRAVAALIKPGGWWVMEETHPIVQMYGEDPAGGPSQLTYSYFRTEPQEWTDGLDYFDGKSYDSAPYYSFMHKLSDIVNAGLAAGLTLRRMEEIDHDISCQCADLAMATANPPQGVYLLWKKG
jgi:ubiquinone/menaquinone biosynthesis C-methylase UbiE